ncbi:kinase [Kitasatospora sp. NPDC059747]|uniref:GHMP family kinase ATP-binding protein n=1 Tax=Kitasatospora sp. NPDC059747 TaxID=3346930 RepID=UPI00365913FD
MFIRKEAGIGVANGTFGELLQGMLLERQRRFLVTLPIDAWSTAVFRATTTTDEITVRPTWKHKSRHLATRILRAHGYIGGGTLELDSAIPEGKGLASSSADLVATARAVADTLRITLAEPEIEYFLRGIEPSDGVMYAGVVSYYHREVRLRERLGFLPPLTVVAHDPGGTVDTVGFNRTVTAPTLRERREYRDLLDTLSTAVSSADLATIGEVATRSAELHTRRLPRPDFEELHRICRDHDGLGLVVAHSGTVLGILLGEHGADPPRLEQVLARCARLPGTVEVHRTLGKADYDTPHPSVHHAGSIGGDCAL